MTISIINTVLNTLSAILGLATVCIVLGLDRGKLAQRVSVQFTLGIAWVDVFKAISIILYSHWNQDGWTCKLVGFLVVWGTLAYMFLNGALALNLCLVYVQGRVFSGAWVKYYFGGGLGLATLLSVILLFLDRLGWDDEMAICEFRNSDSIETYAAMWMCFLGWILLVCVFNSGVVILSLKKLKSDKCPSPVKCVGHCQIQNLVIRIVILCLIPIVTHIWYPILRMVEFSSDASESPLVYVCAISTDLPGILNCLVFLCDPSVKNPLRNFHRLLFSGISPLPDHHSDISHQSQEAVITNHQYIPPVIQLEAEETEEACVSLASTRPGALRSRYKSPIKYWPGTNIPVYQVVRGL